MELINARTGLYSDPQLQAKPWDRLAGESHKAFNAFTHYRDLAERRTFQQVAEKLQCSGANVRRWAKKWRCYDRARDWDVEQDQQYQASHRERKRMAERIAQGAMLLQEIALHQAEKLLHEVKHGREIRDAKGQFLQRRSRQSHAKRDREALRDWHQGRAGGPWRSEREHGGAVQCLLRDGATHGRRKAGRG